MPTTPKISESPASSSSHDITEKRDILPDDGKPGVGNSSLHRRSTNRSGRELEVSNVNAKLANPLAGLTHAELQDMGEAYARKHGMEDLVEEFKVVSLLQRRGNIHS